MNDTASEATRLALSVREVADALGVSVRSVWRLSATDELPRPFRIGRSVRWRAASIDSWLARQERRGHESDPGLMERLKKGREPDDPGEA